MKILFMYARGGFIVWPESVKQSVSVRLLQAVDQLKAGALAVEAVAAALVELEVGWVLLKPELNVIEENLDPD